MDKNLLYILIGVLVLIIIVTIVILLIKNKKKAVVLVDNTILEKIFNAIGLNNIVSVDKEQDRIRLVIKDSKLIDASALQELKIPAFIKGTELKLLYRNHSNELYNYFNERIGM